MRTRTVGERTLGESWHHRVVLSAIGATDKELQEKLQEELQEELPEEWLEELHKEFISSHRR